MTTQSLQRAADVSFLGPQPRPFGKTPAGPCRRRENRRQGFQNQVVGRLAERVLREDHLAPLERDGFHVENYHEAGENRDYGVQRGELELPINVNVASTRFEKERGSSVSSRTTGSARCSPPMAGSPRSPGTDAPLRRPRSIGLEPGGFLREFDHRFTCVAPLRLDCRTRAIRWCSRGPALSGLLPPSPAAPGSDCPQLHQAAATARRRGLSPRPIRQRLVAHDLGLHELGDHEGHGLAHAVGVL